MTYVLGQWKVCCDRCGFDYLARDLRKEWTGFRVCKKCWEPKHPQLSVTGKPDNQSVPWARPEPEPNWLPTPDWPYGSVPEPELPPDPSPPEPEVGLGIGVAVLGTSLIVG